MDTLGAGCVSGFVRFSKGIERSKGWPRQPSKVNPQSYAALLSRASRIPIPFLPHFSSVESPCRPPLPPHQKTRTQTGRAPTKCGPTRERPGRCWRTPSLGTRTTLGRSTSSPTSWRPAPRRGLPLCRRRGSSVSCPGRPISKFVGARVPASLCFSRVCDCGCVCTELCVRSFVLSVFPSLGVGLGRPSFFRLFFAGDESVAGVLQYNPTVQRSRKRGKRVQSFSARMYDGRRGWN